MPGNGDHRRPRRQQVDHRHPPHEARDGAHRRFGHLLRGRRLLRRRQSHRLQPDEFPLGQRGDLPDFTGLAHVAGDDQTLQGRSADPAHHVFRRAARLHAGRRRRVRLRAAAEGLRRDRHCRRGAGRARGHRQGAHGGQRLGDRRIRVRTGGLSVSPRQALRDPRGGRSRRAGEVFLPPRMAGYMGKGVQGADVSRDRHHDARSSQPSHHLPARRAHVGLPEHRHTVREAAIYGCASGCSRGSCRTCIFLTA